MKRVALTGILVVFALASAGYESCGPQWDREYTPAASQLCADNSYQVHEQVGQDHLKYIVWPVVMSDECGCPVSGLLKYVQVKPEQTKALVDFGDGACDGWAIKTLCFEGDCEHEQATTCKFKVQCGGVVGAGNVAGTR